MRNGRRYVIAAAGCLAVAAVLAVVFRPHRAGAERTGATLASAARLDPAHVAALHTARTAVPGVPDLTRMIGPGATPAAGEAHRIGPHGVTLAWVNQGAICEVQISGGGCVPPINRPIEVTISDPDVVGKGQPERVMGLAVDGVTNVATTLADGRTRRAVPIDNFYEILLPDDVTPTVAMTVQATLADGSTYAEQVPAAPPPTATGPSSD
jgi:hypothetical protein